MATIPVNMDAVTPLQVLSTPVTVRGDPDIATIGDYLVALLQQLWAEGDLFSAKRPLGYSDWQDAVYEALVRAGFITGSFDSDGYLDHADVHAGDALVAVAIGFLLTQVTAADSLA